MGDTTPALRPGFVSFTVYARRPPGYRLPTDEEDGSLLYAASNLGVRIVQLKADGSIYRTPVDTSLPVTSGWTKLEFRGDSLDLFHDDPTQAVIDIEIFPFSASAYEPGVVLLAEPALNYYLDGY